MALVGFAAHLVEVEAHVGAGVPGFAMVGHPRPLAAGGARPGPGRARGLRRRPAAAPAHGQPDAGVAAQGGFGVRRRHRGRRPGGARQARPRLGREHGARRRARPRRPAPSGAPACCRWCSPPSGPAGDGSWCRTRTASRRGWCPAPRSSPRSAWPTCCGRTAATSTTTATVRPVPLPPVTHPPAPPVPDLRDVAGQATGRRRAGGRSRRRRTTCSCSARPGRARRCSRRGCRACCPTSTTRTRSRSPPCTRWSARSTRAAGWCGGRRSRARTTARPRRR